MTGADNHFDALETRDPAVREKEQIAALQEQIAYAKANSAYFGDVLKDIDPSSIDSIAALAALPVTRKSDLIAKQQAVPPLGG